MSAHLARISWRRTTASFAYEDYDRSHEWSFDNGARIAASAAVAYRGDPDAVDPEEAFVASVASCHMLTFLAIASRKRIVVDAYEDEATGFMTRNARGKLAITRVELRPRIDFAAPIDAATLADLHHRAHEECFIANSVLTEIVVMDATAETEGKAE